MEKQNKYLELKNKLKDIYKSNNVKDETSRTLVDQTLTLLEIDKLNKLAKHIVSSSDTAKILDVVNQSIAGYRIYLDNLIDGDHKVIYINEYREIKEKLEKLTELRNEIEDHCNRQIEPFDDKYEELLNDFKESLIGNSASLLFERLMAIQDETSNESIYKALESEKVYIDLKRCINVAREKKKNIKTIELCDDILSYRHVLRENIDMLVEYNNLSSEIMNSIGIKSIEELKKKKEKLTECNKRLLSSGLSNLLLGLNTNLKLTLKRSNTPLDKYLQDVRDLNDLINYFTDVKELRDRVDQYINRSFIFEEKYLMNTADPIALTIANTDLETARTLVSMAEEDGNPSLRTLLVEMILVMMRTPINDMNVNEKEFVGMKKHMSKKSSDQDEEFFNAYDSIMNSNEINRVNTK